MSNEIKRDSNSAYTLLAAVLCKISQKRPILQLNSTIAKKKKKRKEITKVTVTGY